MLCLFKCITGITILPPLILLFSSPVSFSWNPLFSSPSLLNFSLPSAFCLVNWLFLLCLSFLSSLPPVWQKVTHCSCWEHLPDDCENKLWLVDWWRKWQMPLPKWLPHKCQKIEKWKSSYFQEERYHPTRTWRANRNLYEVYVWGFLLRLLFWSGSSSAAAFADTFPLDRLKILFQDVQIWPEADCINRTLHK